MATRENSQSELISAEFRVCKQQDFCLDSYYAETTKLVGLRLLRQQAGCRKSQKQEIGRRGRVENDEQVAARHRETR